MGSGSDPVSDAATRSALERSSGDPARRVLIRGGHVLSMDPQVGDHPVGDVLVRGRRIEEVGPELRAEDAIVVDARGTVVIPGLIDSHAHAWLGQLRGAAPEVGFGDYMRIVHGEFAPRYRAHDMYVGTLATALRAIDSGITTILDNSHNSRSPEHSSAALQALLNAGIRAVHASGVPMTGHWPHWPADVLRLRDEYAGSDSLVTLRLFDGRPNADVWRFAEQHELWVSSELGGAKTALAELDAAGLLTPRHTFNHCFALTDEDWARLAGCGASVNLAPRSDVYFGLGVSVPPIRAMQRHGLRPGLSTDNELSYGLDMFSEMRALYQLHRSHTLAAGATGDTADEPAPSEGLSAVQILRFATLHGAYNCDLADTVGSLRPGKQADILLVRGGAAPVTDAAATVVHFARPESVDTVLIAGELRKWRGQLTYDLHSAQAEEQASREYLHAARANAGIGN